MDRVSRRILDFVLGDIELIAGGIIYAISVDGVWGTDLPGECCRWPGCERYQLATKPMARRFAFDLSVFCPKRGRCSAIIF